MNAALIKVDVAAAKLGWSAAKIFKLIEGGSVVRGDLFEPGFEWVFDLSNGALRNIGPCGKHRRDLRLWDAEVEARAKKKKLPDYELPGVVNQILPPGRRCFHAGEVDQLFQIRPRTRIDLHDEIAGSLNSGRNHYHRDDLAAFLKRRWLHAVKK